MATAGGCDELHQGAGRPQRTEERADRGRRRLQLLRPPPAARGPGDHDRLGLPGRLLRAGQGQRPLGTVNYTPKHRKYKGFPPRPLRYQGNPTRIDYVFSTVAPLRHEVVVRLTSRGRFDDRYRASDHNMVMVDLPVR